jgi:hypothetical protein
MVSSARIRRCHGDMEWFYGLVQTWLWLVVVCLPIKAGRKRGLDRKSLEQNIKGMLQTQKAYFLFSRLMRE